MSPAIMITLKIVLSLIMLAVALELNFNDLKYSIKKPKSFLVGVTSQFLLLPVLTFFLVWALPITPHWALGMILIAACPGGNISNFMSLLAKANVALSVCLTFAATILAVFMTPFNLNFWGSLSPVTAKLIQSVSLNVNEVYETIIFILGIPLVVGLILGHKNYSFVPVLRKWLKNFSFLALLGLVIGAIVSNFKLFIDQFWIMFIIVFIHNSLTFIVSYFYPRLFKISHEDSKTISIETGIQNAGLGLAIGLEFFPDIPEAAIISAWWGVWHVVSGLLLIKFWKLRERRA